MGNHSDTGELLEEALAIPITQIRGVSSVITLVDEYGNTIELDNPSRLKDSAGRDVDFLIAKTSPGGLTQKQAEALFAKSKKKMTS